MLKLDIIFDFYKIINNKSYMEYKLTIKIYADHSTFVHIISHLLIILEREQQKNNIIIKHNFVFGYKNLL